MEADGCQVFILRGDTLYCVLTYDDGQFLDDYADRPLDLELFPSTKVAIAEKCALIIESPEDPRLSDYERALYAGVGLAERDLRSRWSSRAGSWACSTSTTTAGGTTRSTGTSFSASGR